MKIAIIGYSGSGKSTLAQRLGEQYGEPVLHLDRVEWLPGWQSRPLDEKVALTRQFLDSHDSWIIDGNYGRLEFQRRMEEADEIVLLSFNRFQRLYRVWKRYRQYRGRNRPDMGDGCPEKLDREFVRWILWEGCGKRQRERNRCLRRTWGSKLVEVKNQRQLDRYYYNKVSAISGVTGQVRNILPFTRKT